jgi:hypothetical protein
LHLCLEIGLISSSFFVLDDWSRNYSGGNSLLWSNHLSLWFCDDFWGGAVLFNGLFSWSDHLGSCSSWFSNYDCLLSGYLFWSNFRSLGSDHWSWGRFLGGRHLSYSRLFNLVEFDLLFLILTLFCLESILISWCYIFLYHINFRL